MREIVCEKSIIESAAPRTARQNNAYGYGLHGANLWSTEDWGWFTRAGSARLDVDDNLSNLRQRSRDLYMSSALISALLLTLRDGVIGRGLRLNAEPDAFFLNLDLDSLSAWKQRAEGLFERWSRRCGINDESFDDILRLVFFSAILSGDCFVNVILDPWPKIQIIEGDRVQTPLERLDDTYTRCGIKFSKRGRAVGFFVALEHPADDPNPEYRYIQKFDYERGGIIHIHVPFERPDQVRGIPLVSRVIGSMKQLDRYIDAEQMAAIITSKFTVFLNHPQEVSWDEPAPDNPDVAPMALGDGTIIHTYDGATPTFANPTRPVANFDAFVSSITKQICAALGLPMEIVLRNYNASYSASRAAILDADRTYRVYRKQLTSQLSDAIYSMWLGIAVRAGLLECPGFDDDYHTRLAWSGCTWFSDALPSLDPTKEVQAAQMRLAAGLTTYARETEELTGMDAAATLATLAWENAQRERYRLIRDNNNNPVEGAENVSDNEQ